jgi:hypothetical protein
VVPPEEEKEAGQIMRGTRAIRMALMHLTTLMDPGVLDSPLEMFFLWLVQVFIDKNRGKYPQRALVDFSSTAFPSYGLACCLPHLVFCFLGHPSLSRQPEDGGIVKTVAGLSGNRLPG